MAYTLVPYVRYLEGPGLDLGVRGRQYWFIADLLRLPTQYVWTKIQHKLFFLISPLMLLN